MSLTVTFYNIDAPRRSVADLQLFLIYCHLTAHSSRAASQAAYMRMIDYLDNYTGGAGTKTPVEIIRMIVKNGDLDRFVKEVGAGRPAQRRRFFESLAKSHLDLQAVDRETLADIVKGIGFAKASMFVMFRGKSGDSKAVIIDKNVQQWMRREFNALGMKQQAAQIPQGSIRNWATYLQMEKLFLEMARRQAVSPRDLFKRIAMEMDGETKYDRADAKRISKGGKTHESHWDSRMSRNEISLSI